MEGMSARMLMSVGVLKRLLQVLQQPLHELSIIIGAAPYFLYRRLKHLGHPEIGRKGISPGYYKGPECPTILRGR